MPTIDADEERSWNTTHPAALSLRNLIMAPILQSPPHTAERVIDADRSLQAECLGLFAPPHDGKGRGSCGKFCSVTASGARSPPLLAERRLASPRRPVTCTPVRMVSCFGRQASDSRRASLRRTGVASPAGPDFLSAASSPSCSLCMSASIPSGTAGPRQQLPAAANSVMAAWASA